MKRLLVTGFGPFPGIRSNPSAALARRLVADLRLKSAGIAVTHRLLPTTWVDVSAAAPELAALKPDTVLLLGVAARRRGLSVEVRAINRVTQYPDASGRRAGGFCIAAAAPMITKGRAPMQRLVIAGRGSGIRVRTSINAGRYLCNYAYWRMLSALPPSTPCVFVHVPKMGRKKLAQATNALCAMAKVLAR